MEPQTNSTQVTNALTADKKSFIGFLLSIGGIVFLLAGIMFFIALMCAIYLKLDIVICFIIGSFVVGIASFAAGSALVNK